MDNRLERENRRLRGLSFPVDENRLDCFSSYLELMGLAQKTMRDLYREMRRFSRSHGATSKTAYAMHLARLDCHCDSMRSSFRSAYHHYQRMCESGYQPGDPFPANAHSEPKPPSDPEPDCWTPFGLKPGHPARVLCKFVFESVTPEKIHFRQTAPDEWRFEGDEFLYRVKILPDKCTMTAHSKIIGKCWTNRTYSINPDGTLMMQ